ncbi:MAG TPA: anti-sigma factor [Actinomycetota bacterium]|nr:anti-sigma factor [Actinomycetota bacterium]
MRGFRELAELVPAHETVRSTLDVISALAVRTIAGCDLASVSLVKPDGISTVGSSDEMAVVLDALQYETGQGPCLDAIGKDSTWFQIEEMSTDTKWPAFTALAAGHGFEGLLAFTLRVDSDTLGALNLYARRPGAFQQEDRDYGAIYAAHAAVTLASAQARVAGVRTRKAAEESLVTQEVIGRAVGILMEGEFRDAGEALDVLEARAGALSMRLRDSAQDVIDAADERRANVSLPPGFSDRTMRRVQVEEPPVSTRRLRVRSRAFLAALVVAGSLAVAASAGVYFRDAGETEESLRGDRVQPPTGGGVVTLTGSSDGDARLVDSGAGSTLLADGLEALGDGRAYQLWLFQGGEIVADHVFVADDGVALVETRYPTSAFDEVAVTVEPAGGSRAPTTDPVLASP